MINAALIFIHYLKGKHIHDFFIFAVDGQMLGKWCRQLVAESLGKEYDLHHNRVHVGITPTVSLGTTDLHSMAQLYLAGPDDRLTSFITIENTEFEPSLHNTKSNETNRLHIIMQTISKATKLSYKKRERPYVSITLPEKSEYFLGQFLQWKMVETIYLAHLFDINPFDQPAVEEYKKSMHSLLHTVLPDLL
jgi:glucose-6-phosphate isomerase